MFKLEECAVAVATAMIGTIRNGDDAARFSARASREGFSNISDLIANDAVKQALALQKRLSEVSPELLSTTITSVTHTVGDVSTTTSTVDAPAGLTDFEEPGKSAQEVFAKSATEQVVATTPAPPVSIVGGQESIDTPLQAVNSAEVQAATTSTSTTTAIVSGVELDSENLPWDVRIHSSSKAKIKDGTWKLKRNLDPQLVEEVKAELRGVMAIPAVEPKTNVDTNPFSVSTVNKLIEAGNGGTAIAPPPPAPAQSEGITTFPDLMKAITSAKLDSEFVKSVLAQFEIPAMPILATRPDLIPAVAQGLGL